MNVKKQFSRILAILFIIAITGCSAQEDQRSQPTTPFVNSSTSTNIVSSSTPIQKITATSKQIPSPDPTNTIEFEFPPASEEIHINADGTGDYTDIYSAVEAAKPGAAIFLSAGRYRLAKKMLVIQKSIQLIGEGMDSTEIYYDGFETGFIGVAGPSLVSFGGEGGEDPFLIEGITFQNYTSQSTNVVSAYESIYVNECRFIGGRMLTTDGVIYVQGDGLQIEDGIVRNSEAFNNEGVGIFVSFNKSSALNNNLCNNNKVGIEFWDANGTIDGNQCNNNKVAGIVLLENSNAALTNNLLTGNGGYGAGIMGTSTGSVTRNTFTNNKSGLYLAENADLLIFGNELSQNTYGMVFTDDSTGTVENNSLESNEIGIVVMKKAHPTINENTLSNNSSYGIYFIDNSFGFATANKCFNNKANIQIEGNADPTIDNKSCP
jgi:parallel beta-helix repeat protein